ncbi:ribosomal protein S18-alanine N-acetyltransferase [Alteromonas sp. 5E99-2]|uniref:ribosomal protein S18-alanine N-acetyltransferase n=1 Tax=Alteromonas sp. 5E99-2 TaxID=2817683 RepID=UPI001A98C080|nr:ribosomal protein S18-alanine N-acetyltransferase [Alteromonas sp. 5E99-2]
MIELHIVSVGQEAQIEECFLIHQESQPYPWSKKVFFDMVSEPYTLYIASDTSNSIIAYAITLQVLDEITLMDIAVHQSARNKGIGTDFLKQVIGQFDTQSTRQCFLEVRAANITAIRVYQKLGFSEVGKRASYYPGVNDPKIRESALIMSLVL